MAIDPGTDVGEKNEPLPRGPVVEQGGQLSRGWFNWFNGKDRMLGEIVSGVNRNRQNIVQLQTDYQAADGSLSSAYIAADAVVAADAASARATLETSLRAEYQAGDATLQTDINTRATVTYVDTAISTEQSARASAISTLEAAYQSADSTITANVSTNASAIASLEGAVAIYEVIAAASGSQPARIRLKAGVGGATIELDADEVYFGAQTRFDLATETFISTTGSVRARYGTAFGAGASVVLWHGPTSVAEGSESRTNGYLALGTDGLVYHNAAALNWGATAAEAAASNAQVGAGANSLVDTRFRNISGFWEGGKISAGSASLSVLSYASGIRILQNVGSGFSAADQLWIRGNSSNALSVAPGDTVGGRALIGGAALTNIRLRLLWYTAAGAYISATNGTIYSSGIPTGAGETEFFIDAGIVGTAPATAASVRLDVLGIVASASPRVRWAYPLIAKLPAGQTVAPPLSLGLDAAAGADVTLDNTAAAISGQGVFATGNYYEQSGDPGSVPNGSIWFKTTTNELFIRRSGSWGKVATIANQNITITRTNGFVRTRIGNGTNTSDSVSFSASGGSGSGYTYAHELFVTYTSGPTMTISSASGSPVTVSATGVVGDEVRGFVITTATDDAGNKSTLTSPAALFWEL